VHGVPGARRIESGDIVSIDTGARLDGWCADAAITVCVGDVVATRRALAETAEHMLELAVGLMAPGRRWSAIAAEMERLAIRAGFTVAVDFVGHGIGRDLHEAPQVPCASGSAFVAGGDFTLRPGMVLAIEPMLVDELPRRDESGDLLSPRA
jgi:methionyl aminopeptidase